MSGNCEIIKAKASFDGDAGSTENEKTLGDAIWNAGQEIDHYLSVICKKTNEGEDSKFPSDWAGSFPNNLFPRRETLTAGNKLDIKMQVTTGEENSGDYRKIVFTGKAFESDIEGEWEGEVQMVGDKFDKPVNVVNITKPTSSLNKIFVSQLV
ncbi:hypothetical protein OVS_03880 [Mycoplasma ovis str. Michigan]|uniref:Lipoprotein n=1 Tax=Mycoplasma ovis str. Michigan TaxID=1415773 RepID=A0ABM5P2D4_9MOLU|nr:hypothetical protein [Mycoplasma ovis]AHC40508.1 hypothetical protein OVS_03880 [Mycoplasma ovis str. Michigan]